MGFNNSDYSVMIRNLVVSHFVQYGVWYHFSVWRHRFVMSPFADVGVIVKLQNIQLTWFLFFKYNTKSVSMTAITINKTLTIRNSCIGVVYGTFTVCSVTLCKMTTIANNVVTIRVIRAGTADGGTQYAPILNTISTIVGMYARWTK